jgi:eukaryotic-like serine/threonine-protein kinase
MGGESVALLIPIFGMITGTVMLGIIMSPFLLWMKYRHQTAKERMLAEVSNPDAEKKMGRMVERLENLEALMCRLDTEINTQLERSLSMGRIVTGSSASGVSQMPTTFMNVASALEGRYQVLKELGRGGMGIVFQAYDKQLKEQVAIKILSPLLSNDPDALERLKREVSAARRITHANVIRIHDIAEVNGLHYVSMEYFGGTNLKEYLKQTGHLSLMEAFNIASQVCDGLKAAHDQGVIHRDLKSQNIIISAGNQIKVIDFGLAHTQQMQGLTATGLIMGTPEYMAPEQVSGKKVDERADVYSLGIILYELFTGKVPFTGPSAIAIGFQQMKDFPPPPTSVNPQIPAALEQVILKALQKDPMQRHRSVAELKQDLDQAVHHPVGPPMKSSTATAQAQLERSSE